MASAPVPRGRRVGASVPVLARWWRHVRPEQGWSAASSAGTTAAGSAGATRLAGPIGRWARAAAAAVVRLVAAAATAAAAVRKDGR